MPMPALQNLIRASDISKGISDAKGIYDQIKGFKLQNLDFDMKEIHDFEKWETEKLTGTKDAQEFLKASEETNLVKKALGISRDRRLPE